jgi:hyperosmotically inducible protein
MKQKLHIIVSASAASLLAFSALAQDAPTLKTGQPDYALARASQAQCRNRLNGAAKASDVLGMTVLNNQGEKLGKVKDLAVDLESGRVVQVILSTGGFIGIGDTFTAVPPEALRCDAKDKALHLDADKEKLAHAPQFVMSKWAKCSDANHLEAVYQYYGEAPAFTFIQSGDTVRDDLPKEGSPHQADGTWDKQRVASENQCLIPASRLGQIQKASKLMGTSVQNLQDEKVGRVENILLDLPSGRLVAVIVSSGGFLGMDDELSAVPPTALRFTTDREALQFDTSKERLSNAPHFKANQWPDFSEPSYAAGVYRSYHVEPYFTTEPDNTARNVRDRDNRTLTPLDQGHSKADVDTTAQIRKEIIADKDMSVNAKNVKIITIDGRVTLRGPVNTVEEKRLIGDIADRIAGTDKVANQLQVKLTAVNN